jgi:hypothetical protein
VRCKQTHMRTTKLMIICRNISDGGFDLSLAGALTGIGPLDAVITFTEPLRYA